jgi:hypothetical protein
MHQIACKVRRAHRTAAWWICDAEEPIVGGMSGSPILADGVAIGVVCIGSDSGVPNTDSGPNPNLAAHLPGWLVQELWWRADN